MRNVLKINSGESVEIKILKIKNIPHISILTDDLSPSGQSQIITNVAQNMAGLLNEIYQLYKGWYSSYAINPDVSLEITWMTHPVMNQPFKASIDLFLVIRAINRNTTILESWIDNMTVLCQTSLGIDKYEIEEYQFEDFYNCLVHCNNGVVQAIVREGRLEDLQNQYLPAAYAFDLFPRDYPDLSKLANILISNPYCALSFQVIPTYFTQEELGELKGLYEFIYSLFMSFVDKFNKELESYQENLDNIINKKQTTLKREF